MMAVAIWGSKASGGAYAAIAALTNILATLIALVVYEAIFTDSSRGAKSCNPPEIASVDFHLTQSFLPIAGSTWVPKWLRSSTVTATSPLPTRMRRSTMPKRFGTDASTNVTPPDAQPLFFLYPSVCVLSTTELMNLSEG